MANEKSLYLVAKGGYADTSISAETWQFGIRLWADLSVPADEGTLPTTGAFADAHDTASETDWEIDSEWAWPDALISVITPVDYLNDQAGPALSAFINSEMVSAKTQLETVTLYPIDDTGHVFHGRKAVLTYHTPVTGLDSSNMQPPEVSCCLSWQTPQPGRRGRGRIYMPPAGTGEISTFGFVGSAHVSGLVTAGQTLLAALAVESIDSSATHVRPIVTGSPWTHYGVIQSVRVGHVWDAQRRRRRSELEAYASGDVTYG